MRTVNTQKLSALVRSHADAELADGRIGGKEIVVHQNGECVYHETFGAASVGGDKLEKNMIYRAASMTKPLTAAAVLQLYDRGLVDIYEPAYHFFPQMREMSVAVVKDGKITSLRPAKNTILVSDLLSHTSGIGSSPVFELLPDKSSRLPFGEAVKQIISEPLAFEPRTAQSYSPTNAFDVAAGIVEKVSGKSYDEYLRENVFEPLDMTDTTFSPSKEQWDRMVTMHDRSPDGKSVNAVMPVGCVFEGFLPERLAAGAGLAVTARDYVNFADMLCLGGVSADGKRVLSGEAVRLMSKPHVPEKIKMGSERWGLGVRVVVGSDYPNGLCPGCFGWSGAYGTHFWVDPENRITAVMMKNSKFDGGAGNRSACELERDVSASLE